MLISCRKQRGERRRGSETTQMINKHLMIILASKQSAAAYEIKDYTLSSCSFIAFAEKLIIISLSVHNSSTPQPGPSPASVV